MCIGLIFRGGCRIFERGAQLRPRSTCKKKGGGHEGEVSSELGGDSEVSSQSSVHDRLCMTVFNPRLGRYNYIENTSLKCQ